MNNQRQNLFRALSVLNSLLIPVFFLFLIDLLNLSFLLKFNFVLILAIIGSLKIYGMSGIAGCILEILSGEEFVIHIRRFHHNAMMLGPYFLTIFVIIRLFDYILYALFPSLHAMRPVFFSLLVTIAAFFLSLWAINKKYLGSLGIPQRSFKFKLSFFVVIISAYLLELLFVRSSDHIHITVIHWRNIVSFMRNYIHVFEFIFCSLYILDSYPEINGEFNRSKELFLINPMGDEIVKSLAFSFLRGYPPFFVVLKALSPKTYKFREFDQVIWHEWYYKSNVLVCITCYTSNSYEAYKIAKEFKKRGSVVVMGGPHVTYLPNEALAFCDSVVIGQAEGVWRDVIRDHENGELKAQYKATASEADYAQVHEELLKSPPSIIKEFLETSRGCKFRCHFCTIPALSGGHVQIQPIDAIVELVKKVKPHYKKLTFIDNNIYSDPGYAKDLFTALKPLKIKWYSECTIDIAKNQETLKLARESGCSAMGFGYEISGVSLEKNQGGKFAMARKYLEYTKIVKKMGIKIKGQFIFGFDSDNLKSLFQLWKFCFSVMPQFTAVSILTPLPGSGVYRDMLTQDRIISLNWRSYNCHRMVVRHPHMDPALLSMFYPLLQFFFFVTTSSSGLLLLLPLLVIFCFEIGH